MNVQIVDSTKDYSFIPGDEMTLEAKFQTFYKLTRDFGGAFYNALLSTPEINTNEVWSVYGSLERQGFDTDQMIYAIICSKILNEKEMIILLKLRKFQFDDCWTTLRYYRNTKFFKCLLKSIRNSGYTRDYYKVALSGGNSETVLSAVVTEIPIPGKELQSSDICFH